MGQNPFERCASNKDGACPEATSDTLAHSQTSIRMVTSIESRLKLAARSFRTQHIAIKATRSLGTKEKWQYLVFAKSSPLALPKQKSTLRTNILATAKLAKTPSKLAFGSSHLTLSTPPIDHVAGSET